MTFVLFAIICLRLFSLRFNTALGLEACLFGFEVMHTLVTKGLAYSLEKGDHMTHVIIYPFKPMPRENQAEIS